VSRIKVTAIDDHNDHLVILFRKTWRFHSWSLFCVKKEKDEILTRESTAQDDACGIR